MSNRDTDIHETYGYVFPPSKSGNKVRFVARQMLWGNGANFPIGIIPRLLAMPYHPDNDYLRTIRNISLSESLDFTTFDAVADSLHKQGVRWSGDGNDGCSVHALLSQRTILGLSDRVGRLISHQSAILRGYPRLIGGHLTQFGYIPFVPTPQPILDPPNGYPVSGLLPNTTLSLVSYLDARFDPERFIGPLTALGMCGQVCVDESMLLALLAHLAFGNVRWEWVRLVINIAQEGTA